MVIVYHRPPRMDASIGKHNSAMQRWIDAQAVCGKRSQQNDDKYEGLYGLVNHVVADGKEMNLYTAGDKVRLLAGHT